jgi:lipid A 3-O-deacylase
VSPPTLPSLPSHRHRPALAARPALSQPAVGLLVLFFLAGLPQTARAADTGASESRWRWPDAVMVQGGWSERAEAVVVGGRWNWAWQRPLGNAFLSGGWDLAAGGWRNLGDDGEGRRTVSQLSLTPVLRWGGAPGATGLFVEGGIGLSAVAPLYRHRDHRFSTVFNFADHLALGVAFGDRGRHELALRMQHFSNAGLREPNPGEDFVQLRYLLRF